MKINIVKVGVRPKLNKPVLIEGLPGIGNVGKIAADFLVDELKAKKILRIHSDCFPNSVFVTETNLVELPTIELYYKKRSGKDKDLLFLTGDIQPLDEVSSFEFTEAILKIAGDYKVSEIVTLGGIGLSEAPKNPRVFCTGNSLKIIEEFKKTGLVNDKLYGTVGPIIGVSGLLVGLSKGKIDAACILSETLGHPMYLGIKGAKETLKVLDARYNLGIDFEGLEKEVRDIEKEILTKTEELQKVALKKKKPSQHETAYIG